MNRVLEHRQIFERLDQIVGGAKRNASTASLITPAPETTMTGRSIYAH